MGLDTTIHLEPFFKIKTIKETCKEKIKICPNHGKINSDYCPVCGNVSHNSTEDVEYYTDIAEITGNEELWCYNSHNEYTYIFSNLYGSGFDSPEENEMVIVNIKEIKKHIEIFKQMHETSIEKIQIYVKKEIKIEYGLFKHVY